MALKEAIRTYNLQKVVDLLDSEGWPKDSKWSDYVHLNLALRQSRTDIAKLFIERGSKVNRGGKSYRSNSPLHYAISDCQSLQLVEMLLERGASIKCKNCDDETPLHIAAKSQQEEIVDLIMSLQVEESFENIADKSGLTYLHIACIRGKLDTVKGFLKNGADVNSCTSSSNCGNFLSGWTPLHIAVDKKQTKVVKLLLKHDADIYAKDENGSTPLHLACRPENIEIINLIMSRDTSKENHVNVCGMTHFHAVCATNNSNIVKEFLQKKIDVNAAVDSRSDYFPGYSALHIAAENACTDTVQLLLQKGANFCLKNKRNLTPLHLAYQNHHEEIVHLILAMHNTINENPVDGNGISHFHIACSTDRLQTISDFLQNGTDINQSISRYSNFRPGYSPLHIAIECMQVKVVELLLKFHIDVNAQTLFQKSPLHMACQKSDKGVDDYLNKLLRLKNNISIRQMAVMIINWIANQIDSQFEIIKLILKHNVQINAKDLSGRTPLFYIFRDSEYETSVYLTVIRNEKIDFSDFENNMISELRKRKLELFNLFIQHKADVTARDDNGTTILHCLTTKPIIEFTGNESMIAELIISQGVDVNAADSLGHVPLYSAISSESDELIDILLKHNATVEVADSLYSNTLLHYATYCALFDKERFQTIDKLVNRGANLNAQSCNGKTALHIAVSLNDHDNDPKEFETPFDNYNLVKHLLQFDCNVNIQDKYGKTPLHYACLLQAIWSAKYLLKHGADINIEDNDGETSLSYCLDEINTIFPIFMDHMKKLQVIGYHCSAKNKLTYSLIQNKYDYRQNEFEDKCLLELNKMKQIKIDKYTSLYDILLKNSNKMAVHVKNNAFINILEATHFEKTLPVYGYLLKLQHKKGLAREKLLKPAKDSLKYITEINLPDCCFEAIFEYLSDENLNAIITAKAVVLPKKRMSRLVTKKIEKSLHKRQRLQ